MNLGGLLTRTAARYPARLAVSDGDRTVTYAQLDARVSQLASWFGRAGAVSGDRIAILMRNRPETIEALFAAFRGGFVAVPISSRLHPSEVAYIVEDAACRILIYGPGLETAAERCEVPITVGPHEYEAVLRNGDPGFADVDVDPSALAWLFYTSGTTGRPKGAMLTHQNLFSMVMACLADLIDFRPSDVVVHCAPLTHGAGLYALPGVARGSAHLVPPLASFDGAEILRLMEREHITAVSFLTPTMMVRLVDAREIDDVDLHALRSIVYGGGPAYVEDVRRAIKCFGPVLTQLYGQGESPMTITYLSSEDHLRDELIGSVGVPHPDLELRLADDEDRSVGPGEVGEVCVRGGVVMPGYWHNSKASSETLRGGWLHTGDVGRFDNGGYVYLLDRKKDLIISGGLNIYPREVEDALLQHPAVAQVAVIGLPDRQWGEVVHAVVVLGQGHETSADELIEFCRTRIASYKKPHCVAFVDELPTSGVGKVLKRDLRDRFLSEFDRSRRRVRSSQFARKNADSGRSPPGGRGS